MSRRAYRFAAFEINESDRLLLRNGQLVPLPPKAADALLLLLRQPRHVMNKQDFHAALWPGTYVEEGSLKQTISQLRKVLGDDSENARFIETIPRRGYRWVSDLQILEADQSGAGMEESVQSAPLRSWMLWFGVAATSLAIVILGLYIAGREQRQAPIVRPFTSYRGGEYEPAFSPDGTQLAFVWNGEKEDDYDIYVRPLDGEQVTRLTTDPAGEGSPAWSPDGGRIGFVRYGADNARSGVYVVPATGGQELKVSAFFPVSELQDRHLDWSPVSDQLAVADKVSAEDPFAIFLIDVATREHKRVTSPPPESRGDTGPVFSRDGREIAFRRTVSAGVSDVFVVAAAGGEPRRITSDGCYTAGLAWSADGRDLLFRSERNGTPGLWRVSATGGTPTRVSGFVQGANFVAVAARGDRLAYSQWYADTNIWMYDLTSPASLPGAPVIASTRAEYSPRFSADGQWVAFRSDRSGSTEIWRARVDGSDQKRLTSFGGPLTGSPSWSPDGKWIAFDSRTQGHSRIFMVTKDGSDMVQLSAGAGDDATPAWSNDGSFVYFSSKRSGHWQIWRLRFPAGGQATAEQLTFGDGFAPQASSDGKFVYFARGENVRGLWRVSTAGGDEKEVLPSLPAGEWGFWSLSDTHLYYIAPLPSGQGEVRMVDPETRAERVIRRLPKAPISGDSGASVSLDGKHLLYTQADQSGSDIMLVERYR